MKEVAVEAALDWPDERAVLLAVTDGAGYPRAVPQLAWALSQRFRHGVVVTANRPSGLLLEALQRAGVELERITVVDCVSSMTGVPPLPQPRVHHVESPTMLEKVLLRVEQALRRTPAPRFVLVDSLSALAVFNGVQPVAEFSHALATRLRTIQVPAALLLVERQAPADLLDRAGAVLDGTLRL